MELEILRKQTWLEILDEYKRGEKIWGEEPIELFFEKHASSAHEKGDAVFPFVSMGKTPVYDGILEKYHESKQQQQLLQNTVQDVQRSVDTKNNVTLSFGDESVWVNSCVYDRLTKQYKADKKTFDYDVFMCYFRYGYLGLLTSGMSGSVSPTLLLNMLEKSGKTEALECFGSFFNHTLEKYCGLFPDIEEGFGCVGNFFHVDDEVFNGKFLSVNPPFATDIINKVLERFDKMFTSGTEDAVAVIVLPAWEIDDRLTLNTHCVQHQDKRKELKTDYKTDMNNMIGNPYLVFCEIYCKDDFPYINYGTGKGVKYTATKVYILSSSKTDEHKTLTPLIESLPRSKAGVSMCNLPAHIEGGTVKRYVSIIAGFASLIVMSFLPSPYTMT